MGHPVVHFEIIGKEPPALRRYYGELFGWVFEIGDATTEEVSERGQYGFVDGAATGGINGGVGGGSSHGSHVVFYVGVPDVEATLQLAERLGGARRLGPAGIPGRLVVGQFVDPAGNLIGVAGERRATPSSFAGSQRERPAVAERPIILG